MDQVFQYGECVNHETLGIGMFVGYIPNNPQRAFVAFESMKEANIAGVTRVAVQYIKPSKKPVPAFIKTKTTKKKKR